MARKARSDAGNGSGEAHQPKSSMDAVRMAMRALGSDAATQALHDHIQSEYGLNIHNNKISAYKSSIRKQAGFKSTRGRGAGGRPEKVDTSRINMDDIRTVKQLADRIGAARLRELIDVLEK
jgi:hypothetical protein